MELIARAAAEDEHEAYTVGLLRQIGKLVLGRMIEKEHPGLICPDDEDIDAWELEHFHITSHEVTALVLESWKLPRGVHLGIRHHHQPEAHRADGKLGVHLHLACWVVQMMGLGLKSESRLWELTPERLAFAGVSEEAVRECVDQTQVAFDDLRQQLGLA
jgi:HD-like signal output (HDOD) protein